MRRVSRYMTAFALLFCGFSLYVARQAAQEPATRAVEAMPISVARGEGSSTTTDADTHTRRADLVRRGEYLARLGNCAGCHTADPARPFAGGRAIDSPFGRLYTPNLTPDLATGIGAWSDADFLRAMHEGMGRDGERLFPAFPYVEFTRVSDGDVLAIRAYLRTLAPIRYTPPANLLHFPFKLRGLIALWNLLNFEPARFVPDPHQSAEYNRGAYLVEGLAHCEECHTPRNLTYGLSKTRRFSGGTQAGWLAYNITPDRVSGIGGWSDDALMRYLTTGVAAGHASAAGPMAEIVQNATQYLRPEDLRAMSVFLRAQPGVRDLEHVKELRPRDMLGEPAIDDVTTLRGSGVGGVGDAGKVSGAQLFVANCASCHRWTGAGVTGGAAASATSAYESLIHNSTVGASSADNLAMVILYGVRRQTKNADVLMPAFADELDDAQIAALANYVTKRFGNPATATTVSRIADLRAQAQ
ncbi:mono/diheme cytochrome c family protein [Paraburkholderia bannensis]|uniref:Mono/diheme cytochrome c family protein n=1 Tax=Paraburkholderia bannensis TaxID=765414 RepID=A0A7W9TWF1_9BURK|nr:MULTISPECIES: cytochrome c [Paraburkholderia]MBB3257007.1 mono/diheme cytochrome c family protein [Paraburkholderia sp. WP4_3_2]MBB6101961.1 mono/diheme cytochrome c family protein [Paraburkholderia bannensis]